MGKIVLLDEITSNQIAAGEVVERPSSVAKELIENAIDAGATNIIVEIKNGGVGLIKVTDNGEGFMEDDVEIAFERHATSKIRKAQDIESIYSFGFRGEALASIASVSNVELITKTQKSEIGTSIKVSGGKFIEKNSCGCPKGTSISINNLFFNTPARYKFMKKDTTEAGHIADIVSRVALGNPNISFKFINNKNTSLHTPGNGDLKSAIYSVYGQEIAQNISKILYSNDKITVSGFAGNSQIARASRNNQSFFINNRYIKSKMITSAIDEAYRTILMKNKYPFIVLNIQINPQLVDVNVHPAKTEVRFWDDQFIFRSIYSAIKNGLLQRGDYSEADYERADYEKADYDKADSNNSNYNNSNYNNSDSTNSSLIPRQTKIEIDLFGSDAVNVGDNSLRAITEQTQLIDNSEGLGENKHEGRVTNANLQSELNKHQIVGHARNSNILNLTDKHKMEEIAENNITQNSMNIHQIEEIESKTSISAFAIKHQNEVADGNASIASYKLDTKMDGTKMDESQINTWIPKNDNDEIASKNQFDEIDNKQYIQGKIEFNNAVHTSLHTSLHTYKSEKETSETGLFRENFTIIGHLFKTYIVIEQDNEILLIDQHAAHERIIFEDLKKKFRKKESLSQMQLIPVNVQVTNKEAIFIKGNLDTFERMGFLLDDFGQNNYIIRSVPFGLDTSVDSKELFLDLLDFLLGNLTSEKLETVFEESLYKIACKSAVKANKILKELEIRSLINSMEMLENPHTCPHGRPTIFRITKHDIEKIFKRIV